MRTSALPYLILVCLVAAMAADLGSPRRRADPPFQHGVDAYGRLPIVFEPRSGGGGQVTGYVARGNGYMVSLDGDRPIASMRGARAFDEVRVSLDGATRASSPAALEEQQGKVHYLIGADSAKWRTNVPTYARIRYSSVYAGIDLVYYGVQDQVEYDFVVAPGANPEEIGLIIEGASTVAIDERGDLRLRTRNDEFVQRRPIAYQDIEGVRREVTGDYVLRASHQVAFRIGVYDKAHPLIIDPILDYSTFAGRPQDSYTEGHAIAVDAEGAAYVAGLAVLPGPVLGDYTVFVSKLNPAGSAFVYTTYVGGSGNEEALGIAVDTSGHALVTGWTASEDFPTTTGALQPTVRGDSDAFVARLNPTGTGFVYSTFLGGDAWEEGWGIAVDASGAAYVTGQTFSSNFPVVAASQPLSGGEVDAFVATIDPLGASLTFSTFLGGTGGDQGFDIAVDDSGLIHVAGTTSSTDFPIEQAFQPSLGGGLDAFLTTLDRGTASLRLSTYLGGSLDDVAFGVAVSAGRTFVTGETASTDFPTVMPLQPGRGGGSTDAFVVKMDSPAVAFATYLGGSSNDVGWDVASDADGNAYVVGHTQSPDFPTVNAVQGSLVGQEAFATSIKADGSGVRYSTYLGGASKERAFGIDVDTRGRAYVTGTTTSGDFPTRNPIPGTAVPGPGLGSTAFVTRIAEPADCSIDLHLQYQDGTLSIGYTLAMPVAGEFAAAIYTAQGAKMLWRVPIGIVDPPSTSAVEIPQFPSLGQIGVLAVLLAPGSDPICTEWERLITSRP